MRVAGSVLTLAGAESLRLCPPRSNYRDFLSGPADPLSTIAIRLETGELPDTGAMVRIFDSNQSWAMYDPGNGYCLEYKPPTFRRPFWTACCDSNFEVVTVHCGESATRGPGGGFTIEHPFLFPLDQLLLIHHLCSRDGVLIHGAGLALQGRGLIFPGRSGAGKSTISRLFLGRQGFKPLSDDRVAARAIQGRFEVFGTPWPGEAGIADYGGYPLAGLVFLKHSRENVIRRLAPAEAFERLMPVTSIPWYDAGLLSGALSCCENLVRSVPAAELSFRPDSEVTEFLEKQLVV